MTEDQEDIDYAPYIARCREALETDDMMSVASRKDWAMLLEAFDICKDEREMLLHMLANSLKQWLTNQKKSLSLL